jgi:hypothetical protein
MGRGVRVGLAWYQVLDASLPRVVLKNDGCLPTFKSPLFTSRFQVSTPQDHDELGTPFPLEPRRDKKECLDLMISFICAFHPFSRSK